MLSPIAYRCLLLLGAELKGDGALLIVRPHPPRVVVKDRGDLGVAFLQLLQRGQRVVFYELAGAVRGQPHGRLLDGTVAAGRRCARGGGDRVAAGERERE